MVKIVLADDHEVVRRGVKQALESKTNWTVVAEASNGHDAVNAVIQANPDVVIVDYSLPGLNGLEVTRRIHHHLPKAEILIFTIHDEESIIAEVLRAGARGFLLKSDTESELIAAVQAMIRHRPYFSWRVSETLLDTYLKHSDREGGTGVLTPREREVVQLVSEGLSNKQVGRKLVLSIKTVETHRAAAMRKLGVSTTADLVRYAIRNHLIEP